MIWCPPQKGRVHWPLEAPVVAVLLYLVRLKAHVTEDAVEEHRGRLPDHLRFHVTGVLERAERWNINTRTRFETALIVEQMSRCF